MMRRSNPVHVRFLLLRQPAWLLAMGLALSSGLGPPVRGAEKGNVMVDKVEYQGWKNNLRLSNGDAEVIVTLDVGPRIISYKLKGGPNVLKEFKEQLGKSGEKEWQPRGGHRFWVGPEDLTRTYALDNSTVEHTEANGLIHLTQSPDVEYGVQKEIHVRLAPSGSRVTLVHRITNVGTEPAELAPWA